MMQTEVRDDPAEKVTQGPAIQALLCPHKSLPTSVFPSVLVCEGRSEGGRGRERKRKDEKEGREDGSRMKTEESTGGDREGGRSQLWSALGVPKVPE